MGNLRPVRSTRWVLVTKDQILTIQQFWNASRPCRIISTGQGQELVSVPHVGFQLGRLKGHGAGVGLSSAHLPTLGLGIVK